MQGPCDVLVGFKVINRDGFEMQLAENTRMTLKVFSGGSGVVRAVSETTQTTEVPTLSCVVALGGERAAPKIHVGEGELASEPAPKAFNL